MQATIDCCVFIVYHLEIDLHGRFGDTGTPSLNASMIDVGILS